MRNLEWRTRRREEGEPYRQASKTRNGVRSDVREQVYERDGWACRICGTDLERDAEPQTDWFPSVDHIEPQSHALIPNHAAQNLRAAHRLCNSLRRDGLLSDTEVRVIAERRRAHAFTI